MADLTPTPIFIFNYLLKPFFFFFFFSLSIPATLQNPKSGYGHVLPEEEMEASHPEARGLLLILNLGLPIAESVCFTPSNNAPGVSSPFWGSPVRKHINTEFSSRFPRWLGKGSVWHTGRSWVSWICSDVREGVGRSWCYLGRHRQDGARFFLEMHCNRCEVGCEQFGCGMGKAPLSL